LALVSGVSSRAVGRVYTLLYCKLSAVPEKPSPPGYAGFLPGTARLVEIEGGNVGRKKRRNDSQNRAAGRVRGRVQQRTRGGAKRGGGDSGRKRNTLDLGAIEGYANRLANRSGGTSDLSGAASGLAKAAPGLAGAASGFAGGSFASRLFAGDTPMSDEDFRKEVAEHFALLEERLQRLEEQVSGPGEPGVVEENLPEPEGTADPDSGP
jgi:hypothetical protein